MALAWSDLLRGIFLLAMIIIVPIVAINHIAHNNILVSLISLNSITSSLVPEYSLTTLSNIIFLSLGWGLGYFGSPHILINFMGIKNPANISKAKYIGISWQILVLAAATIVGLIGKYYFSTPLINKELVFIEMVKSLFPSLLAGFILCAVLAAIMSVMTAQILASASIVSEDFFNRFLNHFVSTHKQAHASLYTLRVSVIAIPLLAYILSYNTTSTVNDLISYAWSGLGLSFAPIVIASLYGGQYVNKYGAIAGMSIGGLLGIIWPKLGFTMLPLLPGFIISMSTIYLISALTHEQKVPTTTILRH